MANHVSQLEDWGDGRGLIGHNNCAEASVARYLLEAKYPFGGTADQLIAYLREQMTGVAEYEGEPYTSLAQVTTFLNARNIPYSYGSLTDVVKPWSLSLVVGPYLTPAWYPASWFSGILGPDHFILKLGNGLVNDPLAFYNNGMNIDQSYNEDSLLYAVEGLPGCVVLLLQDPSTLYWSATGIATLTPPAPVVTKPVIGYTVHTPHSLRPTPAIWPPKGKMVGPFMPAGTHLIHGSSQDPWGIWTTSWRRVQIKAAGDPSNGVEGWAFAPNLTEILGT